MASEVDGKVAEGLGPEGCDQWQAKRPWAQVKSDGIAWARKAKLFQCEGVQRVEEVGESPSWEILKPRLPMVPDSLLWLSLI